MIDVNVTTAMTPAPPTVSHSTSTPDVATELRHPDVPAVLVGDGGGTPDGIVTSSDVVAVVAERGDSLPVDSYMSTPVVSCRPDTPIGIAADRMRDAGVSVLPVVDDGECVGVVTRDGLAPYVSRHRLDIDWAGEPLRLEQ